MSEKPSILKQAEALATAQAEDGVQAGVTFTDGKLGAEVSGKKQVGKGWTLGAVARLVSGKDKTAALWAKWTGKP